MLTERQRRFVEHYRNGGDGPAAAEAAGYSPRRARRQSAELLRRPEVAEALRGGRPAELETRTRIRRELERIAFSDGEVRDGDKLRALEMLTKLLPEEAPDGVDGPECGVVILPEVMEETARG